MNFPEARARYLANPTKEVLHETAEELAKELTLSEKIYLLSGHTIWQTQKDMIRTGRNYNVHALSAGGCRRLAIPPVLFTDGPRGVVMGQSTCFPAASLRACTFDPDLEARIGQAMAREALAQGANLFAGICVNAARNPRWGRTQESYGEDPFLLGSFGAALVRAVQGEGMIACVKHFALNSMEDLRFYVDVHIDRQALEEIYLPQFKKCIEAGALCVMSAYNRVEEMHCGENRMLLTDVLRRDWGFDGFVMSDFVWGVYDAEHSLRTGLDLEMMFTRQYSRRNICRCLKEGALDEEHLIRADADILRALLQLRHVKTPSMQEVGCRAHRDLAREAARKGMVLLENNGVLPLTKSARLLVCGPYADVPNTGDHGSSRVYDPKVVTPYQGLKTAFDQVTCGGLKEAGDADVAIVCAGFDFRTEGEYFASRSYRLKKKPAGKGGDRMRLRLTKEEVQLIRDLKKAGKKVVVLLYGGGAVLFDEWLPFADAVIFHGYAGCEDGNALADLLLGAFDFTGRLPFTIAKKEADYPAFRSIGEKPYRIDYDEWHGYWKLWHDGKRPAYPFGFGRHYNRYELGDIEVAAGEDVVEVTCRVTNLGHLAGAEVVQVYAGIHDPETRSGHPARLLKGFLRVDLEPGQTRAVSIRISLRELSYYAAGWWETAGAYDIYVGTDCEAAGQFCRTVQLDSEGRTTERASAE